MRKVVVHLVKPADFTSSVLQDIINSDKCVHLRMECDRPLNDVDSWMGYCLLRFVLLDGANSIKYTCILSLCILGPSITGCLYYCVYGVVCSSALS